MAHWLQKTQWEKWNGQPQLDIPTLLTGAVGGEWDGITQWCETKLNGLLIISEQAGVVDSLAPCFENNVTVLFSNKQTRGRNFAMILFAVHCGFARVSGSFQMSVLMLLEQIVV